jgi:hypothetical protein
MDINEYAMEHLIRERLSTLRGAARQHALAARPMTGLVLRVWLGGVLIHAGQWLRAGAEDAGYSQPTHG